MKSLVVGMGIGNLYRNVLTDLGYAIVTVDSNPSVGADYTDLESALVNGPFDTAHICTPNYTHEVLARLVAPHSAIVFVEKPGLKDSEAWAQLVIDYPNTKFMMVKNNMWRRNIDELRLQAAKAKNVDIEWIRRNCVPSPGSWFTTRKLAFGGVSRDLMPHMLSIYVALNPKWRTDKLSLKESLQNWQLKDIDSTEYGQVDPHGVYDVDDQCYMKFADKWWLRSNWRSGDLERSALTFVYKDGSRYVFELGWCPEEAYKNMIEQAVTNLNNNEFWQEQLEQDLWIHKQIQTI